MDTFCVSFVFCKFCICPLCNVNVVYWSKSDICKFVIEFVCPKTAKFKAVIDEFCDVSEVCKAVICDVCVANVVFCAVSEICKFVNL